LKIKGGSSEGKSEGIKDTKEEGKKK